MLVVVYCSKNAWFSSPTRVINATRLLSCLSFIAYAFSLSRLSLMPRLPSPLVLSRRLPTPCKPESRAIDAQLLVDRALASTAKALPQSVLNNVKSAKSPPGNGVTAPPVQPAAPGNGVTPLPKAAAPPGNGVTEAAPPSQPAAPDALPVRAFNAGLLADRSLASSAKSIFQSIVNDVKSAKSCPPSNGVTPPVQPVAPPSNDVTAAPPPAQPVAPPSKSVTDAATSPPTIPDALPVCGIDAELLVDRALASSANRSPPQPVTPPSNSVLAAPPPAQAAAPPSNSVTDVAPPPPVIPDAVPGKGQCLCAEERSGCRTQHGASVCHPSPRIRGYQSYDVPNPLRGLSDPMWTPSARRTHEINGRGNRRTHSTHILLTTSLSSTLAFPAATSATTLRPTSGTRPAASVLCFCEPDTPCARPLGWGDTSPYGSDDYGGASGSVGVSAHGRLRGDRRLFGGYMTRSHVGREVATLARHGEKQLSIPVTWLHRVTHAKALWNEPPPRTTAIGKNS
ncbi:hypothetical protein EDB83DRAFT_2553243 [Lactarius deliciosus]|nr:hypothetical protein EDB83DRAFT_2553243 [Lactarius deliciosus]